MSVPISWIIDIDIDRASVSSTHTALIHRATPDIA